jgi:ABC-type transport system involved in cytochrome bd biosynthesis fused ATPase/permease subunit
LPLFILPTLTAAVARGTASLRRLGTFFKLQELEGRVVYTAESGSEQGDTNVVLSIKNTHLAWKLPSQTEKPKSDLEETQVGLKEASNHDGTLKDINLEVKRGELAVVVGRVGSGKSSLLSGILGEMFTSEAEVEGGVSSIELFVSRSNIAYCAQTPWIMNARCVCVCLQ